MLRFALLLISVLPFCAYSQGYIPAGARSNAMANSSVALSDAWAYHHNPGALATINKRSVGVSYENRFLLKELQSQGLVFVQPLKKNGVISFGAQSYGFKNFRIFRVGSGYSLKLSEKLFAGVQLNYHSLRLTEFYGSTNAVTAETGILCLLNDRWRFGMSIFNLGRAKLSRFQNDRLYTVMRLGTTYSFSDKLIVAGELEKNLEYDTRIKAGLEYAVVKSFYFRTGLSTSPLEFSFGFGYKLKAFELDLASFYHQQLGWSPQFGLTYTGQ